MNEKIYWSDKSDIENWYGTGDSMTFWVCPKKWWSIKDWKLALDFRKNMRLFFIKNG